MTKRILSTKKSNYNPNSRNNKFNNGLQAIVEFYKEPAQKLMLHLLAKGYTTEKISKIVGISRQAVETNWLKPIEENK